jgi:hypothetical protein
MVLKICPICKEYVFGNHKCKSIFYFKHFDWGEEFQEIRADSFRDAAEEFAKLYNEDGDYSLMNSSENVVISDGKVEKKYRVSAEPDIYYNIEEIVDEQISFGLDKEA